MSAPTIIQRTISGSPETAIQISNGQFGRAVTLPAAWSQIRIGIRFHLTDSGGALNLPNLAFGFGSGTTAMVGDATTTNWIGCTTKTWNFTRNAGPPPYYNMAVNNTLAKKVGATWTTGGALDGANHYWPAGANTSSADRVLAYLDITKGAPNYTGRLFYCNIAPVTDISSATFLSQMILGAPVVAGHTMGGNVNLAFDEVAGALNAVQVYWDRSDSLLEICDLAVALLA